MSDDSGTRRNLGDDLAVGELRAVIMGGDEAEQVVTLAARVPDGVLVHNAEQAQVGFLPGLLVVREENLSVPILVLFLMVNQQYEPPCDLAVNVTDASSMQVMERLMAQERLHLVVSDSWPPRPWCWGATRQAGRCCPGSSPTPARWGRR